MDGSGEVYSGFPSNNDHDHTNDPKQCSVRGCTQLLTDGTNNKMCDVCRSRHRIYASTKRARRKLEKAAVANAAAARNGGETFMLIHESDHSIPPGSSAVTSWLASPSTQSHQQDTSPLSSQQSPSTSPAGWNQAIDPRLFSSNGIVTSSPFPAQTTSTSSELANALTLPTPRPKAQPETPQQPADQSTNTLGEDSKSTEKQSEQGGGNSSGGSTRFCSVKGCKAVIPESYEFKMCPPCRTRYRTYGNTKRAKWKMEREAFDHEMATLRAIEDEKRKSKGLGPLADNPEELRAWELSIIDEQIELPIAVPPPMSGLQPSATDDASMNFARLITGATAFPADLQSPMVMAGVYPASIGSIDTPHSISPYPHLHNTMGPPAAPLPARMCTVSHCHKILPGYYRYKRCEQHRLQNRHHSQLKRVREKEVKSVGPEDGATPLEIDESTLNTHNAERAKKLKLLQQSKAMRKERKPRGTKKVKDGGSEASEPMVEDGAQAQDGSEGADVQGSPTEGVTDDKEPKPKGRPKVYSCTKEGCYNLLVPTQRWRTCDECRMIERKRQLQVRADQKAAESVYWKGISERMSAEKKAEAATGTSTAAAGGGSSDAQAHVQGADNTSSMDVDPDPDAEGESEHFGAEEHVYSLVNDQAAPAATPVQLPTPPTTGTTTLYGPTTSTGNGFSKFFVQLPPAPPPVRKATSEELLKLSDTLTSRVYRPKSTPSAIGRILAHNPHVSVDDFSDILEVDPSKPPDPANPTNETTEAQSSNLTSTEVSDKSLPTATVPTSAPFVYDATARRSEKSDAQTTSSSSKGKRKHKSSSQSTQSASAGPSTSFVPPMTGPANSYTMPYAYPPSYSYYPYYMPPYSYPPPALGSDPTKQSYLPPMISSTGPLPPTSYYPYPYAPPSYGYNAPPPAYPYLPPRYTIPPYGQTSGQQPYPGPTSSSGPGYSYYPPPPPPPLPPPAPTPASAPAPAPAQPPPPKPKPKETEEPKGPTTFSFHHYKLGQSGGPQEPRKRLKADPNYLEKFKAHTSVIKMSLMPYVDRPAGSTAPNTVPSASGENTALSESTQRDAPRPDLAALQSTQQNLPAATMEPAGEASTSAAPAMRPCATKTCSRSIPAETHGTICEKCKLRFKKHQAKAKVKYKLEPRKFLKVKSSEGSTQSGV